METNNQEALDLYEMQCEYADRYREEKKFAEYDANNKDLKVRLRCVAEIYLKGNVYLEGEEKAAYEEAAAN